MDNKLVSGTPIQKSLMLDIMNSLGKKPDTLTDVFDRHFISFPKVSKMFKQSFGLTPAKFRDRFKSETHTYTDVYSMDVRAEFSDQQSSKLLFGRDAHWKLYSENDVPIAYRVHQIVLTVDGEEYAFECTDDLIEDRWVEFHSTAGNHTVAIRPTMDGSRTRLNAFVCHDGVAGGRVTYDYVLHVDVSVQLLARASIDRLKPDEKPTADARYTMTKSDYVPHVERSERHVYLLELVDKTFVLGIDHELVAQEAQLLAEEWKKVPLDNTLRRELRSGMAKGTHQFPDYKKAVRCQDGWVSMLARRQGHAACLAKMDNVNYIVTVGENDDPADLMYLSVDDRPEIQYLTDRKIEALVETYGYIVTDLSAVAETARRYGPPA